MTNSEIYNSQLISRLNGASGFSEVEEVLEEIRSIAAPVFIYPLRDAFLKHQGEYYDHYFIWALGLIESPEIISVLKGLIFDNESISAKNYIWAFGIFAKRNYFDEDLIVLADSSLSEILGDISSGKENFDEYDMETVTDFLILAKKITDPHKELLKLVFLSNATIKKAFRKMSLRLLLKIDKDAILTFIIENFDIIHGVALSEIVLAEIIVDWSGPKSDKIKGILKEKGGVRAKDIITKKEEEKEVKDKEKEKTDRDRILAEFPHSNIIVSISNSFNKANELFQTVPNGCDVFNETSLLINELAAVKDKNSLTKSCTNIRSIFEKINPSIYNKCDLDQEKIKSLFPIGTNSQDFNKPLNRLFLYLHFLGLSVDFEIYGLRKLNTVLTKIGSHQNDAPGVISALLAVDLVPLWHEEKWFELHSRLLIYLDDSLKKMTSALSTIVLSGGNKQNLNPDPRA